MYNKGLDPEFYEKVFQYKISDWKQWSVVHSTASAIGGVVAN